MKDIIADVAKSTLEHSIAQTFFAFSGILVIISIWTASNYVPLSFFTLFYAFIAHVLTALRRHESLGKYFVGNDKWQIVWFTLSYIAFFVWWSTGTWSLLNEARVLNLYDFMVISFSTLSFWAFAFSIIFCVILFIRFFTKLARGIEA